MVWNDPVTEASAALLLVGVLGSAALHKALHPVAFRETLRSYQLVPDALVVPTALAVAVSEIGAVVLLMIPSMRGNGAWLAAALLGLYAAAIAINLYRGRTEIDCGCSWGGNPNGLTSWLLVRNTALLPFAGLAAQGSMGRTLGAADYLVVAATGFGFFILYQAADRLISNAAGLRNLTRTA
jgi:hypothetical protein